jgi:hypothetical protein
MTTQSCRARWVIVLAAIVWSWAAGLVWAQTAGEASSSPSFVALKTRVPVGDEVYVTDTTGGVLKGRLDAVTDDAVQVYVGADLRRVAAGSVRRIQWQQPDSPLTGVLIGAGIGAIPGLYWLAVDPNECGGLCAEEYALIAIGAAIGGWIDHAIKKKVTVYERRASDTPMRRVAVGPLLTRERIGVRLALRF